MATRNANFDLNDQLNGMVAISKITAQKALKYWVAEQMHLYLFITLIHFICLIMLIRFADFF